MTRKTATGTRKSRLTRALLILLAVFAALAISLQLSPRPGTWLIARVFDLGAASTSRALARHVPDGIETVADVAYASAPETLALDIHRPRGAGAQTLPTIVWVHGGGWISGRKEDIGNYLRVLAGRGFVTVSVDYTLAPDAHYPAQLLQVNQALGYLSRHAARLGLDMSRVVLAGDSAGAQIVAQLANVITAPAHARQTGIRPELTPAQLRAVLLFCGPHDFSLFNWEGALAWPLQTAMWALTGEKEFRQHRAMTEASVVPHVTAAFPPAFITAGNADPLLPQSVALAERLRALGVTTDTLFFPPGHTPALGHEYQFDLDDSDGRLALMRATEFVQRETRK